MRAMMRTRGAQMTRLDLALHMLKSGKKMGTLAGGTSKQSHSLSTMLVGGPYQTR